MRGRSITGMAAPPHQTGRGTATFGGDVRPWSARSDLRGGVAVRHEGAEARPPQHYQLRAWRGLAGRPTSSGAGVGGLWRSPRQRSQIEGWLGSGAGEEDETTPPSPSPGAARLHRPALQRRGSRGAAARVSPCRQMRATWGTTSTGGTFLGVLHMYVPRSC